MKMTRSSWVLITWHSQLLLGEEVPDFQALLALYKASEPSDTTISGTCLEDLHHAENSIFAYSGKQFSPISQGKHDAEMHESAARDCQQQRTLMMYGIAQIGLWQYLTHHASLDRKPFQELLERLRSMKPSDSAAAVGTECQAIDCLGVCMPWICVAEHYEGRSSALRIVVHWLLAKYILLVDESSMPPLIEEHVDWLVLLDSFHMPRAFVTFVSPLRRMYWDGAVMLGLSLQQHAGDIHRIVLLEHSGKNEELIAARSLLENAGWHVQLVPEWQPPNKVVEYWRGSYAKIEMFRLPIPKIVFVDADCWVRSNEIVQLFESVVEEHQPVAMVRDTGKKSGYNTGVLALRPDWQKFNEIKSMLWSIWHWHDDQPAINNAYSLSEIHTLPYRFNVHSDLVRRGLVAASEAVVVHFTGYVMTEDGSVSGKPTLAHSGVLRQVQRGIGMDNFSGIIGGGSLYAEYFAAMASPGFFPFLSKELQHAILQAIKPSALKLQKNIVDILDS